MAKIFKAPEFNERSWPEVAEMVHAAALANGWSPSEADWVCANLKPRYLAALAGLREKLSDFEQSKVVPEANWQITNEVAKIYREAIKQLFGQMIAMQFDLAFAKFARDGDELLKGSEKTNAHHLDTDKS
jgi:hypothetical protein